MSYLDEKYNFLKPLKNSNLIRAGVNKDGGYVVDSILFKKTEHLLSLGMGDDWSFELDFLSKNEFGKISIYDHSINFYTFLKPLLKCFKRFLFFRNTFSNLKFRYFKFMEYFLFVKHKKVSFYKEKISKENGKKFKSTSLTKAFKRLNQIDKIILKIDIEGYEYEIIDEIINNYKRIEMVLLEFHNIDCNEKIFINCMKKLLINFEVIHLHGNNHCGQCISGMPIALEVTMVNKVNIKNKGLYEKNFPRPILDFPNNPYKKDIFFSFK